MTLIESIGQRCDMSRCPQRLLLKVSFGKLSILIEVFVYSCPHISHSCCDMGKGQREGMLEERGVEKEQEGMREGGKTERRKVRQETLRKKEERKKGNSRK
jgi:hypothetical protein